MNVFAEGRVSVVEDCSEKVPRGVCACVLGADLLINKDRLENYCWSRLDEMDLDLLVVAGACAYIDRKIRRRWGRGWARRLELSVPVYRLEQWRSAAVHDALIRVLNYLTGDQWLLDFRRRNKRDRLLQLEMIDRHFERSAVLSYSGGLDSFAQLRLHRLRHPEVVPLMVTTEHGSSGAQVERTLDDCEKGYQVGIPLSPRVGSHAEPSYRTRTLLFLSCAAVAWRKARAEAIVIGEPGQGAVGPSLVPFAQEQLYRGSSPVYTHLVAKFLKELWGEGPRIEHPNLWSTKGQMLTALVSEGNADGWDSTRSCSRDVGRQLSLKGKPQCGICSGCLYRRLSAHAARLKDTTQYYFHDLGAAKPPFRARKPASVAADLDVALCAVLNLAYLAQAADAPDDAPSLVSASHELALALRLTSSEVALKLRALVRRHREEWEGFLGSLPRTSWIVEIARGIQ